jgi:D-sedoheptulose 7-phosphate isomerase
MARPYLFLDRDGTLIEERHYLSDPEGVALSAGAVESIRAARELGWGVAVLSNQSGVGRGLMTRDQVEAVNERVQALLAVEGASVDQFCVCPHAPEDRCTCRKPKTGLVLTLAREESVDLLESVVVGDKTTDLQLARNVGCRAVLVRTGHGGNEDALDAEVLDDLSGLPALLRKWSSQSGAEAFVRDHFARSAETMARSRELLPNSIVSAATEIADALRAGKKLLICGNGGSAADSQHLAAEFIVRLSGTFERRAWPAIALTTDSSVLTAFGNDYGFERVFARQVEALGAPGDVLIAISTSGNSPNVLRAVEAAQSRGIRSIGLLGGSGGQIAELVEIAIVVPTDGTQHVQESHLAIYHLLCGLAERMLYPSGETESS